MEEWLLTRTRERDGPGRLRNKSAVEPCRPRLPCPCLYESVWEQQQAPCLSASTWATSQLYVTHPFLCGHSGPPCAPSGPSRASPAAPALLNQNCRETCRLYREPSPGTDPTRAEQQHSHHPLQLRSEKSPTVNSPWCIFLANKAVCAFK